MSIVKLRTMENNDLSIVRSWRNHPSVRPYMYTQHVISEHEHRAWYDSVKKNEGITLLIFEIDGAPTGFVSFSQIRKGPVAEWGFYLSPDAHKGTGRLLGDAALDYSFGDLGLTRIYGEVIESNTSSIRFHNSLGFHEEGILRNHFFDGNAFHSVHCFGLLSDEWKTGRAN